MSGVFLDTGLFIALAYVDDDHHDRAIQLTNEMIGGNFGKPLQTSSAVITETAAVIHRKSSGLGKEQRACEKISKIFSFIEGYKIGVIFMSEDWFGQAKRLYQERKGFLDFVDTLNVTFLRNNNVNQIVSFDSHYDQFASEGIVRIC